MPLTIPHLFYLAVVERAEHEHRQARTDQGPNHIPEAVEGVSLCPHHGVGGNIHNFNDREFTQFVGCAEAEAGQNNDKHQQFAFLDVAAPQQKLLGQKSRYEALGKVPHPVEVIALPTKLLFPLIEQRILGVSLVRAVQQQQGMQKSHHIDESAEAELPVSHDQQ